MEADRKDIEDPASQPRSEEKPSGSPAQAAASKDPDEPESQPLSEERLSGAEPRRSPLDQTMAAMQHLFQRTPPRTPPPPSAPPPSSKPASSKPASSKPASSKPASSKPASEQPPTPQKPPKHDDSITVFGDDDEPSSSPISGIGPDGTLIVPLGATPSGRGKALPIPTKGDRIGGEDGRRFEIIERLGAGGMAVVLLAKDTVLDRTVAIKFVTHEVLGAAGAEVIERFKLEARASARLSHENIVRVFDLGTSNSVPFLVMEHLEGRPLDSVELHHEIDARRAVRIMADIARGLSHAHKSGIVHRDLKPSNVFIVKDGRAKIVDFGLASVAFGLDSRGTEWLALAGTPRYMSPEQWKGEPQDGRTDIWAAGVMLFEMLVGRPPFPGESIFEVRSRVLSPEPAPAVRKLRPDLPEDAARLVERALAKDVTKRLQTADELLDGLVAIEVALNRATRIDRAETQARERSRHAPERRQATFLSCSLANLMTLSEDLELDDFSELLDGFFEVCATVVRQLDGTILSSLGGRVVACFGFPNAHEDDAQRALRAAFLISNALHGWARRDGTPHAAQIGVHTSLAIATTLADTPDGSAPILQGEAPHVAMWLEENAAANEILMSRRTQELVRRLFDTEAAGERTPEGATRAIETFRALRMRAETKWEPGAPETLTPLVGREAEVKELRGAWDQTKHGAGQFVMITGEAGIGKSRLIDVLKEHISTEPHRLVGCQSWQHFKNTALYPIATGLTRVIGLAPEMPAEDQIHRLEVFLSELGITLDEHIPYFASLLSIPLAGGYVLPSLSPDLLKGKVFEAVITLMLRLAAQEPTLLLLEDLHWSDTSTLELLGLLQGRMQSSPLMLLLTFRPDFAPPWAERTHVRRITLQRLTSAQITAMAAFASQGRNLPIEVIDRLIHRTDGIPLFVEELTRMVADAWEQAEQNSEVISAETFLSKTIPAGLNGLLAARLDRLTGSGKEVAQLGAVLGREFSYGLIQAAAPFPESALQSGLMQLVEGSLLRYEGAGEEARYVFKHALLQDAAYNSLVKGRRQELHLRAARAIVEHFLEAAELHPELVGHHFAEAAHPGEAVGYFEKAGQRAVQRFANSDAATHYARAISELMLVPGGPERDRRELSLQLALGPPLMATRGHTGANVRETYERARHLCELAGDDAQLFPAVLGLTQYYTLGGESEICLRLARQLLAQAERSGDTTLHVLAHRVVTPIFLLRGEVTTAREHTEKVLEIYDRELHGTLSLKYGMDPAVASGSYLAWCLWYLGFADQAVARGEEAVALAREIRHPPSLVFAMHELAAVHNERREHDVAHDLAQRATALATENKLAMWLALCKTQLGWALFGKGDPRGGEENFQEGITAWTKTGAKAGHTTSLVALARGQLQAGWLDQANDTLSSLEVIVVRHEEHVVEAEILRLRGELTLALDPTSQAAAESCFRRGLDVARRQQTRAWELRSATSLARLLFRAGRPDEAAEILGPVLAWFREGLQTADLCDARELLAACERPPPDGS